MNHKKGGSQYSAKTAQGINIIYRRHEKHHFLYISLLSEESVLAELREDFPPL